MSRRIALGLALFAALTTSPLAQAVSQCTAGNPSLHITAQSTPTSAFTDNLDGTVTHNLTGLTWKRCSEGQTWNSGTSTCDGTAVVEYWSQALFAGVSDLTGGHTDWRLPNRKELESIVETCGYNPAINQFIFPATPIVTPFFFFSSTPSGTIQAWITSFTDGHTGVNAQDYEFSAYYVRLVRGGTSFSSYDAFPQAVPTLHAYNNGNVCPGAPTPTVGLNTCFQFSIGNSASIAASAARVVDVLPPNVSFVSAGGPNWNCTNAALTVTCDFSGSLPRFNGFSPIVTLVVTPTSTAAMTNHFAVDPTGGTSPPPPGPCTFTDAPTAGCGSPEGPITPAGAGPSPAHLIVFKSPPAPPPLVGVNSRYQIAVFNVGGAPTSGARVQDVLPATVTFVSATGVNWSCGNAAGTVTCDFTGTIAAASSGPGGFGSAPVINIVVTPTTNATLTNYVSVDPTGGTNPPAASSCASSPPPGCGPPVVSPVGTVPGVLLRVSKSQPSPVPAVGANTTYVITVFNDGSAPATTAQVKDFLQVLPTTAPPVTFVSATGNHWACGYSAGTVTCNFSGGSIPPGGLSKISIVVAPTSTAYLENYYSVDPTGGSNPPDPSLCTVGGSPPAGCGFPVGQTTVAAAPGPSLSSAKSAPSPMPQVGVNSTYVIWVTNNGTAAATSAQVQEILPLNATLVSATGTNWTCVNASGVVTCSFSSGSIAANGGTSTINIVVTPTSTAALMNYVSVDASAGANAPVASLCAGTDTYTGGCGAPVGPTPVSAAPVPSLSVVKSAPSPPPTVGLNTTYTITVTNNGGAAATTAQVQDALPPTVTYVSATGTNWSCTNIFGLVVCNFSGGSIAAGGGTSTISLVVTPNTTDSITNFVSVDPTGGVSPPPPQNCTHAYTPAAGCGAPVTSGSVVPVELVRFTAE